MRDNREELARVLHHPGHVTPSRVKSHCLVLLVVDQKGLLSFRRFNNRYRMVRGSAKGDDIG